MPLAVVHAYCESVRLVVLMSIVIKVPGWGWLLNIALNVTSNLLDRCYWTLTALTCCFPSLVKLVLPGMGMLLHQDRG